MEKYDHHPDYLPRCMTPGDVCPVYDYANDDELEEQVSLLLITKKINEATMDAEVLKGPYRQLKIYDDVISHGHIETTWSQWKELNKPKN